MSRKPIHILLVEDNPGDTFIIRKLLVQSFGTLFRLETFEYLSDACSCLDSSQFDICLLDFSLPDSQGLDSLMTLLRQNPQLPIVMLTSLDDEDFATQSLHLGAQDYLIKDQINQTWLKRAIQHAIERSQLIDDLKVSELKMQQLNLLLRDRLEQRTAAIQKMHQQVQSLRTLSAIDPLTQITNRLGFEKRLKHEWDRNVVSDTPLSLIMIDIDYFKQFNDTYGHQGGDDCLRQVAQSIKKGLHRPYDLVARYGGEEFVVILPNTLETGARVVAERLCQNVRALKIDHTTSKNSDYLTISLGFATAVPTASQSPQDLLLKADLALYQAKHNGRDRIAYSQPIYH